MTARKYLRIALVLGVLAVAFFGLAVWGDSIESNEQTEVGLCVSGGGGMRCAAERSDVGRTMRQVGTTGAIALGCLAVIALIGAGFVATSEPENPDGEADLSAP